MSGSFTINNLRRTIAVATEGFPTKTAAYTGARRRSLVERLSPFDRGMIDTVATANASDHYILQKTIDEASDFAVAEGRRVRVRTNDQIIRLGVASIELREGVDLDLGISPVKHERISQTRNEGSIPFIANGIKKFSLTGGEIHGPGSWRVYGTIYRSSTYAVQLIGCSEFVVNTQFVNGQSGLLLRNCERGQAWVECYEIAGTGLAIKGGNDLKVGGMGRNVGLFLIFGEQSATDCQVIHTEKWRDGTKYNAGSHPYHWYRQKYAHKVALNPVSNITHSAGVTTITVTRDPTVGTDAIPALAEGGFVRMRSVVVSSGRGYNDRNLEITDLISADGVYQIVCDDPTGGSSGTYASGGFVADMQNTTICMGLEAAGFTEQCSDITIKSLISRDSGDAGCSLSGDDMKLLEWEVTGGYLGAITFSGYRGFAGPGKSRNQGHWNSGQAKYGGNALLFAPSAGNVARDCVAVNVDSVGDINCAILYSDDRRFAPFDPGGPCGKSWCYAPADGGTDQWIFRIDAPDAPETFGLVSPLEFGFEQPADDDDEEHIWWDGGAVGVGNAWIYYRRHVGAVVPLGPTNCRVLAHSYDGPGVPVIDQVGRDYNNKWTPEYPPFEGPIMPVNRELLVLPSGGTGSIVLTATPQEVVKGLYGARTAGNFTVSRMAGLRRRYAIKMQRHEGTSDTGAPYVAWSVSGDDLYWLLGKYPSVRLSAWCGANWSDNNQHFSWTMLYSTTSVLAFDSDLSPTGALPLDNNASDTITTTAQDCVLTSDTILPTDAVQFIFRLHYSPNAVLGDAGANDWWAFEEPEFVPSDSDFGFRSELPAVTASRLA